MAGVRVVVLFLGAGVLWRMWAIWYIISEGGADVLVLGIITKPPSLFGSRAPRNQV